MTEPAPAADIVLPCLDEAAALPWVLGRIPPGWRAIVVDNGSTDGSARIAEEAGALVVREPVRGFGSACHAGLRAATAELVCFCDCDGSLDPALLPDLAAPVLAGRADLVLGRRRPTAFGAWPPHARLANFQLARMVRRRTGLRLHDLGPMRAARRTALLDLTLTDRRSGYPLQMVVRAADAGWRIAETDVPYTPRSGRSKVTGTWRGTWHAVRDMSAVLRDIPVAPTVLPPPRPAPESGPHLPARPPDPAVGDPAASRATGAGR
ncbi:dTDP-L-rhamnose 4-epimerase [Actinacidiphila yanglinensis]|uniref:dTDP-L-rhamnose 4-epimerase n=1 Tax=Actinacidiphila yanglinensis TaxID=310779 RepID=A0A1H5XRF6_9ACTN|nr:glycosyltransferase family 2 protein [Actinacidiphila yanglinensis]SEG14291.1 dTDP-L-rhamnose 4-epimerase [Actinacidiphila yanglinensis]